jgi:hypothetical protein
VLSPCPNRSISAIARSLSHIEAELSRISGKVDDLHAVLMQARGVRWAVIAVSGLVGFRRCRTSPK